MGEVSIGAQVCTVTTAVHETSLRAVTQEVQGRSLKA